MFNESQYPHMIADGRLTPSYLMNKPVKSPVSMEEPPGTHKQYIRYLDEQGEWVVEVFQYLRPDGTLGGNGKPDPKRIRMGNTIYIGDTQQPKEG